MIFANIHLKKNQFCSFVIFQDHGNIFLIDCYDGNIRLNYLIYNYIECLLDKLNTLNVLTFSSPSKHFFSKNKGKGNLVLSIKINRFQLKIPFHHLELIKYLQILKVSMVYTAIMN